MRITAITIENFKGIQRPLRIEIKPITLLFGPNSAGKSTIIQAMHYAREIFENRNLNPDRTTLGGDTIDLGGFESLVYEHNLRLPIRLRFDIDLLGGLLPEYLPFDEDEDKVLWDLENIDTIWVQVTVKWSQFLNQPVLIEYEIGINDDPMAIISSTEDGRQVFLSFLNFDHPILHLHEDAGWKDGQIGLIEDLFNEALKYDGKIKIDGNDVDIPVHFQKQVLPKWESPLFILEEQYLGYERDENPRYYPNAAAILSSLIVGPGEVLRDALRELCYVGPLRKVPARGHKPSTSPMSSRWADGLAAYDTLLYAEPSFINEVNDWLTQEERLNSGYKVEVKEYWELETSNPLVMAILKGRILDEEMDFRDILTKTPLKRRLLIRYVPRNIELEPADIGVGISQVLPVVVAALHHGSGLVVIEQPELHIHPAFQVALGDIFIEQVRENFDLIDENGGKMLTFILETHSEHLMLRFLRRLRETNDQEALLEQKIHPWFLSINFIEQDQDGISCLPIRVDEDGDFIDPWPRGFFNERIGELY